jgi:nitroreductase
MPVRALLSALLLALGLAAPAQAGGWRWPVRGPLVGRFHYGPDPFAAGQRRGIEIAAPAGAPVRSACAGRVTFAGAPPRAGRTVSVVCGGLVATYLHLAAIVVRAGARVSQGERLGAVGATGLPPGAPPRLHLGARRRGRRLAYIDPLALLGDPAARPPVELPLGRAPRGAPLLPRAPFTVRPWRVTGIAVRPGVPLAAWIGLALAALAAPGIGLRWRRRRRRARAAPVRALRAR